MGGCIFYASIMHTWRNTYSNTVRQLRLQLISPTVGIITENLAFLCTYSTEIWYITFKSRKPFLQFRMVSHALSDS